MTRHHHSFYTGPLPWGVFAHKATLEIQIEKFFSPSIKPSFGAWNSQLL
jgi:hypothetical protein